MSMNYYRVLIFFVLVSIHSKSTTYAQSLAKEKKALICLTYDDGLDSHLTIAIPQLDSFGLKATFFINSIRGSSELIGQASPAFTGWKKASNNGHELGNHTLFHPCPEKLGWQKDISIESYSLEQILEEIRTCDAQLDLIYNKKAPRAFAFPCNNVMVEGKDYSIEMKNKKLVQYARIGGDKRSYIENLEKLNVMQVPSWMVEEGTQLEELISFAEKAATVKGMAVYQFHSLDGQLFSISIETQKKFLQYLKENQQRFEIKTFSEALQSISKK
jgi:peptidoglycan-N-acetylglucosamine deacetylase